MSKNNSFCLNPYFIDFDEERCCITCRNTAIYYVTKEINKGNYHRRYAHVCSGECFNMWLLSNMENGSMSRLRDWQLRYDEEKERYI